jgi:hypothetical protein
VRGVGAERSRAAISHHREGRCTAGAPRQRARACHVCSHAFRAHDDNKDKKGVYSESQELAGRLWRPGA